MLEKISYKVSCGSLQQLHNFLSCLDVNACDLTVRDTFDVQRADNIVVEILYQSEVFIH